MRCLVLSIVVAGVGAASAFAQSPEPDDAAIRALVAQLGDEAFEKRDTAEARLLALGPSIDAALAGLEPPADAEIRARLQRIRGAFAQARRLAAFRDEKGAPTGAFWRELRRFLAETLSARIRAAVLEHGQAPADAAERLERATAFAKRFVLEWNEMVEIGSEEERRYAALERELLAHGAAAVPALLDVLAVDQREAFTRIRAEEGVTMRMQVRALFAVAKIGDPAAVPALVRHVRSPSFTGTMTALAGLQHLTGESFAGEEHGADLDKLDAWWKKNRERYEPSVTR